MRDAVDHGLLLIAAPKTNGTLPVDSLGGTGIFTAILVAICCVEMMRFLKAHNIGIRLPDQVPPMIKNSFDLLIPVLVVVLTLYPLSLFIQHHFDMLIPQAIMAIFKPLVSAADSCRRSCWRFSSATCCGLPGSTVRRSFPGCCRCSG